MARHFTFHSAADLRATADRLGLDLRLADDFAPLFEPVEVGPLRAANAVCIQPMEGCDGTADGRPGELTVRRYRRFGAGGAGLIWGEAAAVCPEGRANPRQLLIDESTAPEVAHVVRVCREAHREAWGDGVLLGVQLTHSGRFSFARPLPACRDGLLDARRGGDVAVLDDDYLEGLIGRYALAARLARQCGFDFVDVKQCHGYLLNELLGARTRPGRFGGSFENRTRLATEIITRIGREVPDLLIATRLNVFDGIPYQAGKKPGDPGEPVAWQAPLAVGWGTSPDEPWRPDLSEPLAWVGRLRELGVQLVNVTLGNPYTSPHLLRPFEQPPPDGYEPPEHPLIGVDRHFRLTAAVQAVFPDLAVVGSGYSYLQEFLPHVAAANLRDRRVRFVGLGRASLSMPDFVGQLRAHGSLDRRRVCRTFSYCTALMRSKHNDAGQFAAGCPPFDKEVYGPIWRQAKEQR